MHTSTIWSQADRSLHAVVAGVAALLLLFQSLEAQALFSHRVFNLHLACLVVLCCLEVWAHRQWGRRLMPAWVLPLAMCSTVLAATWAAHFSTQAWALVTLVLLFVRCRVGGALAVSVALIVAAMGLNHGLWGAAWQAHVRTLLAATFVLAMLTLVSRAIQTMQTELRRKNALLHNTLDCMHQGLMVLNAESRVVLYNQRACELLDLPAHLLDDSPSLSDVVRFQHQRGDFGPSFDRVDAKGQAYVASLGESNSAVHMPARYTRHTPAGRYLEVVNRPMPDGTVVRTYTDISLYMDALNQAEASAQAKSRFLANMSHELRTPLNAVLGFSELLEASDMQPDQREQVRHIHSSGAHLLKLLNGILDFVQAEPDATQQPMEVFDLHQLLERVAGYHRGEAKLKALALDIRVEAPLPTVLLGHPARLERVLGHLLGNAVKFTRRGAVGVLARVRADGLVLEVSDTGIGMSKRFLPKVFDAFSQADDRNNRLHGGAGLGAALCKRWVDQMQGRLSVRSEEGVGTHFDMWLPWRAVASSDAVSRSAPQSR